MLNVWIYNGNNNVQINGKTTTNRVEGTYTRGKNLIPTCQFSIYPDNDGYGNLVEYVTLVRVLDDDGIEKFGGRIISIQPTFDASGVFCKSVTCEGWMGYLNDSISYWYGFYDKTRPQVLQQLLNHHNSLVGENKAIEFTPIGEETDKIDYDYFDVKTYEAITNEEMLSTGYTYEVVENLDKDTRELKYLHTVDASDTCIELGKNLENISVQNNFEDLCTRVIPKTKDGTGLNNAITGQLPYVDADESTIKKYGIIMKVHEFEGVSNTDKLQAAAKKWIVQNSIVKSSFSVSAVDLYKMGITKEAFELYKKYRVICLPIGLDEYMELTQITTDLNDEWNTQLTFGDKEYKATQYVRR